MTLVAIHQPNFLPWLGWFDKLARADVFVLLDQVQLQRTGGSWVNRAKVAVDGKPHWLTVPIERGSGARDSILEARVAGPPTWRKKMLRLIDQSYARAPCIDDAKDLVRAAIDDPEQRLAERNIASLARVAGAMDLDWSRTVRASCLDVDGKATDLLIAIIRKVGGTKYLVGGGADGYQENEKFEAAGIEIVEQKFDHPRYPQVAGADFIPGLSIIDAAYNIGFSAAGGLLRQAIVQ